VSYMHINNLYKDTTIMLFHRCWAMEKVHGTSAHIGWKDGAVSFFAGGSKHDAFVALFNDIPIEDNFTALGHDTVTVYGEVYGGKINGMSKTYGKDLRFIAFEVKIGDCWLSVDNAAEVSGKIGLDFVPYRQIDTDLESLNSERDRPSELAERLGIGTDKVREGIVLRPLQEFVKSNGERVIAKHKAESFQETVTRREVGKTLEVTEAEKAAFEWVTDMRMSHVLDAMGNPNDMSYTPRVMAAMLEDVLREGAGEVVDSKETRKAIGRATLALWKARVQTVIV